MPLGGIAFWNRFSVYVAMSLAILWTVPLCIVIVPVFWFHERGGHHIQRFWARGVCRLFGIRLSVEGYPNVPKSPGFILAPNHQSMFDMPVLACLDIDFKWVSKQEVKRVVFLAQALKAMGSFFLSRTNSREDVNVLKEVERGLLAGKNALLFPEGTRTRDGQLQPLKKGAFRASQNTGAPLLPLAVQGSFEIAQPRRLPEHRGHPVHVTIGPPLFPRADETPEAFMERYRKELVRLLDGAPRS